MSCVIVMAWLAVIVAVEALTELITSSSITFGMRDWFNRPAPEPKPCTHAIPASNNWDQNCCKKNCFVRFGWWLRHFIGELLNCGYCTSVWVALAAAHFAPTGKCVGCTLYAWPIFFIKVLVIHRVSNLMHELFKKWFNWTPFSFVVTHIHSKVEDGSKES